MLSFVMRSDWRYLLRHTRDGRSRDDDERSRDHDEDTPRSRERGHTARNYYTEGTEHGEPAGTWWGRGAESVGLRGEVTEDVMETLYGGLIHPVTGEALGTPLREYASFEDRLAKLLAKEPDATPERIAELKLAAHKSHREARTYADLTFSPPKSWSVLHAALEHAGRHAEADTVWDAWEAGVHAGLRYLMDEAGYSRSGYHGAKIAGRTSGRWVDAHEYVISLWRHHTSRDGDPQMHIHAAVLNRVVCADGGWRSLDSAAISAARPAAGAISERVAEEQLSALLGVELRTRPDGKAREIVGITEEDRDLFSSRSRAIKPGVQELAEAYEAKHGRAPSRYVLRLMAEHVTLTTRARKPERTPPREELLVRWEQSIHDRLGKSLDDVVHAVRPGRDRSAKTAEKVRPKKVIEQAIADVKAVKAVWNRHDLVAAVVRHLPERLGGLEPVEVRTLVDSLADRALSRSREVVCLTVPDVVAVPAELRRADGRSQFEPHRPERYATRVQLEREESLLAAARQTGAVQVSKERIEELVGTTRLGGDQRVAVAEVLGSGRKLDVLVGPAGTGKSYTVGTLAELWKEAFGTEVFGIAMSQNAVGVLRDEGIERGANVTQFLDWHEKLRNGEFEDRDTFPGTYRTRDGRFPDKPLDRHAIRQREKWEEYRNRYAIRKGQLVVIDEASMISAADLTKIAQIAKEADAKVLVTGDSNQLGAIGAGGVMQLLVDTVGAVRLAEVRRFAEQWEREASLRIRDGEVDALLEYDRRGRLAGGSAEQMAQAALDGFLGDYLAGKRSVLVVGDNDRAAELASKVRDELVGLGLVDERGAELHDGTRAGAGDLIQTRRNDYRLPDARTGKEFIVVNREVWRVEGTGHFGGGWLAVRRDLGRDKDGEQRWGPLRHLPAEYVREHVELAYAGTVHAVQGRTVDTSHALVDPDFDLPAYYVATTRGVESNLAYMVTRGVDEHYLARLSDLFERAAPERTATHVQAEEFEAADHLGRLGPIWSALLADEAHERYLHILVATLGEERAAEVAAEQACSALYRLLRSAELDGHDVARLVEQAVSRRELDTAGSIAQVLHHRVTYELAQAAVDGEAGDHEPAADRYRDALVAALGEERAAQVARDPARDTLYGVLRSAELNGHDMPRLVREVVSRRELDTAESIAQVLHYRVTREIGPGPVDRSADGAEQESKQARLDRAAEDFVYRSYGSRTPVSPLLPERVSRYVHALARQMDERAAYLAEQAAIELPVWAAEWLGPVPQDPVERMEWTERAQAVAAYREHFGVTSLEDPIGPQPGRGNPERRVAWEQAATALGIGDAEREMAGHTVGELANLVEAYAREEAWMPPNVDERLRTAHIAAREAAGSVARLQVQLDAAYDDDLRRIDLAEELSEAEERAARMREEVAGLEEIAEVRAAAVKSVAPILAEAQAAREELRRRGIDPETLRREGAERETEPELVPLQRQHAAPEHAHEHDETVPHWIGDAGREPDGEREAEADAREPATDDDVARRAADIDERLSRLEAKMARWGEATSDAEHAEPERAATGTPLFAGFDDRLAGHAAAEARAAEPAPETGVGEDHEAAARRMIADWFGTGERTPERDAAREHAGDARSDERVREERAAERAPEVAVGEDHEAAARRMIAAWYGTGERTPERDAAREHAGDARSDEQVREKRAAEPAPEMGVGEDHEAAARRMIADWFGTGERTPGHEAGTQRAGDVSRGAERSDERVAGHGRDEHTEQQPPSPAGPALDPQRVWRGLTQQERYEAETARTEERGQASRSGRAEELDPSHAAPDARLAEDFAAAREAAERLAAKEKREWTAEEELDYILRRAQGKLRQGERPPPRLEEEYKRYQQPVPQQKQQQYNDPGRQM